MPVFLTCVICGNSFSVIPSRVRKGAKYCSYRCHQIGEGRKGGNIRGDQLKKSSKKKTYEKESGVHRHRLRMEEKLGRKLKQGEVVHHKDGNKFNNNDDNLILLKNQSEHTKIHINDMLAKRKVKHGY